MASALMNVVRRAGRLIGIGGNSAPANMLDGIYTSSVGTPPQINTRALLEGFDTMPWLRACSDKIGTALGMSDWKLYAVGAPPAPKAPMPDSAEYTFGAAELAQVAGEVASRAVAAKIRAIRGQLEPWAQRDRVLQRQLGPARWKNLEVLRKRGMLQEIAEHPLYDALDNPNPFMGRVGLIKMTEVSLDLVGDAFWLKERNGAGAPVGFWPVPAHWIVETPTPKRPFFRVSWRSWQKDIPEMELLWFHEPAPVHPYERGSGIGWALGDELEIDEYLAKMTKQMFFNDADPKWIFAGGEGTSETEMRRLERDFIQKNQGFWRKFKPYFLAGGGDDINKRIHEFQRPTMEQLVYPGLRKAQRDIVLQTFGAPPELFGITESSNRATAEAAKYLFEEWVVLPRGERMRSILQSKLLPEYDDRLVLDFPNPTSEDKEHELNIRKAAPWAWTADEWRHLAGDQPLEVRQGEGAVHLVPLNSYVTSRLGEAAARPQAKPPAEPPPSGDNATRLAELDVMKGSVDALAAVASRQPTGPPPVTISRVELHAPPAPPADVQVNVAAPNVTNEVKTPEVTVNVETPMVHVAAPEVHVAAPAVTVNNEVRTPTTQDVRIVGSVDVGITDVPDTETETTTEVTERSSRGGIEKTKATARTKKKR